MVGLNLNLNVLVYFQVQDDLLFIQIQYYYGNTDHGRKSLMKN